MGAGRRAFAGTVVVAGVAAGVVVVVETGSGPAAPPDLTGRVVLVQNRGDGSDGRDRYRVLSVASDGGDRRPLFGGDVFGLAVSPDGTQLAYCTTLPRGGFYGIAIARTDGARTRVVGRSRNNRSCARPSWSPDGRSIVFVRRDETALLRLPADAVVVVGVDGRAARTLLRGTSLRADVGPTWSPDGRTIALARGAGVTLVRSRDGGGARQLVPRRARGALYAEPAFSPDGRTVAFLGRGRREAADVWLVGVDGRGLRRLTHARHGIALRSPVFSPDGRTLLYLRSPVRRGGTGRVPRTGSTVVRFDLRTGRTSRLTTLRRGVVTDISWR